MADRKSRLNIPVLLATGFGLGRFPVASGTVGALLGLPLAVCMWPLHPLAQIALSLALTAIAIPICSAAERQYGTKDDRRVVADEYLTFPICVLGLPWAAHPWLLVVAFVVNRAMDVLKPPPAYQAQRLPGGLGIVADDAISCLYALALNHAVWWAAQRVCGAE